MVVRQLIRDLGQSKTVLVSTHILQEVEPVADRVLFIHDGKIVFDGKPARTGQPEWKPRASVLQPDGPAGLKRAARACRCDDRRHRRFLARLQRRWIGSCNVPLTHTTTERHAVLSRSNQTPEERMTCGDHA